MITPTKNLTSPVILFGIVALGLIVGYFIMPRRFKVKLWR